MDEDREKTAHERLIEICDFIAERIATNDDPNRAFVLELHRRVWDLRWELDFGGGNPVSLRVPTASVAGAPFGRRTEHTAQERPARPLHIATAVRRSPLSSNAEVANDD